MVIWTVLLGIGFSLFLVRKYREYRWGYCYASARLDGRSVLAQAIEKASPPFSNVKEVAIVTGANSGIGKEVARDLAGRGATVILACRNKVSAQNAVADIRCTTRDGSLIIMELDLSDISSIKSFVTAFSSKFNFINILVNNAGLYMAPEDGHKTKDGFEIHFGVNHLGHFLLTHLLCPTIMNTTGSRIVIVTSSLYKYGKLDFSNLNAEKGWDKKSRNSLYNNSKLANIYHAQELSRRCKGIDVFACCPGLTYTNLFQYTSSKIPTALKVILVPVFFFVMRSTYQGAQTPIFCAVSEELNGKKFGFFRNCREEKLSSEGEDSQTAANLWKISMSLLKLEEIPKE